MIEKAEDQVNKTSFTEAEHQLISMKISYKAEEYVPLLREASNQAELNDLLNGMLEEYRVALDDLNIKFVEGVPQYFESTIPTKIVNRHGEEINLQYETGNHINALTRGNPSDPDEIVVVLPGTDFSDSMDRDQTFGNANLRRALGKDYTDQTIQYIEDLKEKYPNAVITVDGHSMAGKVVIQIGMMFPDVEVYAFNPTILDKKYREMLKEDQHYDNINVFIFDKELAGYERRLRYGPGGLSMKNLPFNVYHMDAGLNLIDPRRDPLPKTVKEDFDREYDTSFLYENRLNGFIDQHSSGGYRSVDGHLIDLFQLNRIDFSSGGGGTKEIIFSKEKYLHFANIIRKEFIPNLRKALATHEEMEENIDNQIRRIVNDAEDRIWEISVEPDAIYSDPRGRSIEDFKDKYYRSGKYRCYDGKIFEELLEQTDELWRKMNQFASLVEQIAIEFESSEQEIANQIYGKRR